MVKCKLWNIKNDSIVWVAHFTPLCGPYNIVCELL